MAITKIWSIKTRLDTSINYIINPDKTSMKLDINADEGEAKYIANDRTENCCYVKAYNCTVDNAFYDMLDTKRRFGKTERKNGVLAYHLVQSFKGLETTPEVAHKCGLELIEKLFGDKYEVIIGTHLDRKHLHNHILINSVSFTDGEKYRSTFKSYFQDIRGISDQICRENCLSVIEHPKRRGMHYAEWKALQEGKPTIRGQMRDELDEIIKSSYTYTDFWKILEKRGYVIHRKGANIKHTSVIPPYGKRAVRLDNLGDNYTEQAIAERIKTNRNGIRTAAPTEIARKTYKFKGSFKNMKGKKLKGFIALYFHYLYLFKKIRRKQTPQRVSFFMREELIKLDRYQRQFKFLVKNDIETGTDLQNLQKSKEDRIDNLILTRTQLYAERTDENQDEVKEKAKEINAELIELRKEVRLCKAIFKDAYLISEKKRQAQELQQQSNRELQSRDRKKYR